MNWTMGASETDLLDGIAEQREPAGTANPPVAGAGGGDRAWRSKARPRLRCERLPRDWAAGEGRRHRSTAPGAGGG